MMKYLKNILVIIFCFNYTFYNAQSGKMDSLKKLLPTLKEDSGKVNTLIGIARIFRNKSIYDSSIYYSNLSAELSKKLKYRKGFSLHYSNLGIIYYEQGNYALALDNHFLALKEREAMGDSISIASSYSNIGLVYDELKNYDQALKNFFLALKIDSLKKDKLGIGASYNNIGNVFFDRQQNIEALKYHLMALQARRELVKEAKTEGILFEAKRGVSYSYNNIGNIYKNMGSFSEALTNYNEALRIKREMGDKRGLISSLGNIADVYLKQKKYAESYKMAYEGINIAKELHAMEYLKDFYTNLPVLDSALGNFKEAFRDYKIYISYRDSLISEKTQKKAVEMQMQYEFDKKEAAIKAEQEKKEAIAKEENARQALIRNFFIAGFALMFIMALLILRSYRIKQKANRLVSKQKELLEVKNKEITDSIHYAKRIQNAHLPSSDYISKKLVELKHKS